MKKVLFLFFFLVSLSMSAQKMELIGGMNHNYFYDIEEYSTHKEGTYNSKTGYAIRLAIEEVEIDWITFRFTLSYDNYGGKVKGRGGGLGGSFATMAKVNKGILSVGIFPFNFKIIDKIDINLGVEIARLLHEKFNGKQTSTHRFEPIKCTNISDRKNHLSAKSYFGVRGRIAYDIKLSEEWAISPQYSYYLGLLTNEFDDFPVKTKSMHHYLSIGIQKKL